MSTDAVVFHLSFPVTDLALSIAFYERVLGATRGRSSATWQDVILFGHQVTLHEQPAQVLPREAQGVRHFGAILGWEAFEALRGRVDACGLDPAPRFLHRDPGGETEHAKLLLDDPDGHLIELKAYRSLATVVAART
jgi:extradiol dioxygenase family protein